MVRKPIGSRHAGTVDRLTQLWTSRLGERAIVRVLTVDAFPDVALSVDELLLGRAGQ